MQFEGFRLVAVARIPLTYRPDEWSDAESRKEMRVTCLTSLSANRIRGTSRDLSLNGFDQSNPYVVVLLRPDRPCGKVGESEETLCLRFRIRFRRPFIGFIAGSFPDLVFLLGKMVGNRIIVGEICGIKQLGFTMQSEHAI